MATELFPSEEDLQQILLGPESVTWRYASDVRLLGAGAFALLLQVSHPTVGAGVNDYSDFAKRPYKRLLRTLDWINLMIYGGAHGAAAGRRLRDLHKGFRGTREDGKPYYALERDAYAWVHATLIEATVRSHAQFGRPMTPAVIDRFYEEYRGLGRLVGVRDGELPDSWPAFRAYYDAMVADTLVRTTAVDRVAAVALRAVFPPIPGLPRAVTDAANVVPGRILYATSIGLLEPELRDRFGLTWSAADERRYRRLGALSRSAGPLMPRRLEVLGPQLLRVRRRTVARGPLGPGYDPERWRRGTASARAAALARRPA